MALTIPAIQYGYAEPTFLQAGTHIEQGGGMESKGVTYKIVRVFGDYGKTALATDDWDTYR